MRRLESPTLGSLQRRLRTGLYRVHAEPLAYGSPGLIELELHLAVRVMACLSNLLEFNLEGRCVAVTAL